MKINADPLRDMQEEETVPSCESCEQDICPGDWRFHWENQWLCSNCFYEAVEQELRERPEQIALEMGLDMERY